MLLIPKCKLFSYSCPPRPMECRKEYILAGIFFLKKKPKTIPTSPSPKGQARQKLWGKEGESINQKQKAPIWVAIRFLRGLCWENSWRGEGGKDEDKGKSQSLPVPGGIGAGPLVLSPPLVQGSCLSLAQIAEAGRTHELQPAKSPHGQWW